MNKLFVLTLVAASAVVSGCSGGGGDDAPAVPAPYTSEFDAPGASDAWLFYNPDDAATPPSPTVATLWGFDGTAADVAGGAFVSPDVSLNYNNGADYNTGATKGVAISPKIDISTMTVPLLVFKCNYETEDDGASYDQRHLKVGYLDASMNPVYYFEEQLSTTPGAPSAGACAAMGTWHEHVIPLDPGWGQVRVAFGFDSIDGAANAYKGWFVDDFAIIEASTYTPWSGGGGTGGGGGGSGGTVITGTYTTDFESGAAGWTVGGSGVAWGVDGSPTTMTGFAWHSGTSSLNYNNSVNYHNTLPNAGTATSPLVDIAAVNAPALTFWCNYETETAGTGFDQRWVRVKGGQTGTLLYEGQLAASGGAPELSSCSASGTWHTHTLPLDALWGVVKIEFTFDTIDEVDNEHPGWFIDDLEIGNSASGGTGGGSGGSGGGVGGAPGSGGAPASTPAAVEGKIGSRGGGGCGSGAAQAGGSLLWLAVVAAALALIVGGARR